MKRSGPIARRTPLERRRRAFIVSAFHAAAVAPRRRSKTTAGEFSPKQRRIIYDRFQGRCAYCGDPLPLTHWTAQHRRARGMGGSKDRITSSVTNGVAVHEIPCHREIEAKPFPALLNGFRVPQGQHPRDVPLYIWTGEWVVLTDDGGFKPTSWRSR